jgi:hypothetical protein
MKFERYLQETQTPEWKKAYIDYSGLKKRIAAIHRWHEGLGPLPSSGGADADVEMDINSRKVASISDDQFRRPNSIPISDSSTDVMVINLAPLTFPYPAPSFIPSSAPLPKRTSIQDASVQGEPRRNRFSTIIRPRPQSHLPSQSMSLCTLLPTLPLIHHEFFSFLDVQLEKIERFYFEREKEARAKSKTLEGQLRKLENHRRIFDEAQPSVRFITLQSALSLSVVGGNAKNTDSAEFSHKERLDPEEYRHARKKLKKAVLEHYRCLEMLNDYRVLNITGFRKALKKYEKVTKVSAQQVYMTEKVEASPFSSGSSVDIMIKETEELFAARFERGDKKRAVTRLRAASQHKSHHFSTFRSGIALGLALPALFKGVHQSLQPETRAVIQSWDVLLFIYSVIFIPVLFSLLVGINLLVWSNARINYVFIFELDIRTRLNHRVYFEIPSILFATLAYAFWLSFSNIVSPTLWPAVWLGFTFLFLLNPLPMMFRPSRWWLVKNVSRLLASGVRQVEFTDFWMGDQFCSFAYTLSNVYFIGCAYALDFGPDVWVQCGPDRKPGWGIHFMLAILPSLLRLVQSVRRYADSKLITHLINGGKYGATIIYYLFYYIWRHHGVQSRDWSFILYCLFATVYTIYACTWDILMDWSFFKSRSEYPLLRPELIYTSDISVYYIALLSNVIIRFIWVLYLPQQGPDMTLRTFIVAMLEMLRRWQWNFYRLENEHLGNIDQYRVTREVPLPYSFDDTVEEEEEEEDGDKDTRRRSWMSRHSTSWRTGIGRSPYLR